MKLFKTVTLTFLMLPALFTAGCRADNETTISRGQLPEAARTFIQTYFSHLEIAFVTKERDGVGYDYEVKFTNGFQADFDNNGDWTEVDCLREAVPDGITPQEIVNYVAQNYPNQFIVKIDRDRKGYEIKLSSGVEIDFDKNFRVTEIDR